MTQELIDKAIFEGKEIRRTYVDNQWWFSIIDIISVLTDSDNSRNYWNWMKSKNNDSEAVQLSSITRQLKLRSPDGRNRKTDCANVEGIFRIIQSIPSKKAEPFKQWLARLGKERLEEIENPQLGVERARKIYQAKGYPQQWIDKRIQSISIRKKLTDEWGDRGAQGGLDFAVLTNEIMKGAFSMTVGDYKQHKGLQRQELRDHMTDLELIITMLGEASSTSFTQDRDSEGMPELKKDAQEGGDIAGRARRDIESRISKKVISEENFLGANKPKDLE